MDRIMNFDEIASLGFIKREVEPLKGLKVGLRTLTGKEQAEAMAKTGMFNNDVLTRFKFLKFYKLASAIENINGKPFTDFDKAFEAICTWNDNVSDTIYEEYMKLEEESTKAVESLKKSLVIASPVK